MNSEVPVTEARDELADLINRVAYGHERIILTRHSKPVACIVPPEDLARLEELDQRGQEEIDLSSAGPVLGMQPRSASPRPLPIAAEYRPPGQPRS
jgi:prevent-host-death family protein